MNTMDKKDEKYQKVVIELNRTICNNLRQLLKARNLSQRKFCNILAQEKTSITRSQFSKLLADPEHYSLSGAFLLSCCDFFGVSLHNLVSPEFNAYEYISNETSEHKDYLNIQKLLQNQNINEVDIPNEETLTTESDHNSTNDTPNLFSLFTSTDLITNPSSSQFAGYIQDYYCYYYPTHSSENKKETRMLKGVLSLAPEGNFCRSTLTINTNTINDNGEINYKRYTGYAVISTSVNSVNCIMYSDALCEFCFIMFRYFKLNFDKQQCRIAEVLSSSSAAEERRPTVLRMFLSQEEIDDKDLELIAPAFSLNYSKIVISRQDLLKIREISENYCQIVDSLIELSPSHTMYFCKENDVINTGNRYLKNKNEALEFLMRLRASSYAYRYNKVGSKADEEVRHILISRGYFKKKSPNIKKYTFSTSE